MWSCVQNMTAQATLYLVKVDFSSIIFPSDKGPYSYCGWGLIREEFWRDSALGKIGNLKPHERNSSSSPSRLETGFCIIGWAGGELSPRLVSLHAEMFHKDQKYILLQSAPGTRRFWWPWFSVLPGEQEPEFQSAVSMLQWYQSISIRTEDLIFAIKYSKKIACLDRFFPVFVWWVSLRHQTWSISLAVVITYAQIQSQRQDFNLSELYSLSTTEISYVKSTAQGLSACTCIFTNMI